MNNRLYRTRIPKRRQITIHMVEIQKVNWQYEKQRGKSKWKSIAAQDQNECEREIDDGGEFGEKLCEWHIQVIGESVINGPRFLCCGGESMESLCCIDLYILVSSPIRLKKKKNLKKSFSAREPPLCLSVEHTRSVPGDWLFTCANKSHHSYDTDVVS